jgi:hypothetical protein
MIDPKKAASLAAIKAARLAVKLAKNPKERQVATSALKKIMNDGFFKTSKEAGKKVVEGVKNKLKQNQKELKEQLAMFTPKTGKVVSKLQPSKIARTEALRAAAKKKENSKIPTGDKQKIRVRANVNKVEGKAPKQLEMFTKAGKVRDTVNKSNDRIAKAASDKAAAAKSSLIKRRAMGSGVATSVGGVGYALGKGNNKPTPTVTPAVQTKKVEPSQTPSEAKAMLEKKRAAAKERIANQSKPKERKTIDSDRRKTPRQRMLDNENKRLKDRKYK